MSGIQKNVAGQKWTVFVFNRTNNQPVLGDAANITAKLRKDWGVPAATNDINPTEVEDGYYDFDLTQVEVNADQLHLLPESATADIQVIALPAVIFTEAPNYNAKAVSALNDLAQSSILSDATPFAGANLDATISSRSNHAAADIWSVVTRELTSNANLNDPTAIAIRDAILDRVLPLNHDLADTVGAFLQQLDATISSRSSHAAPDLSNLDVAVSTRSSHSEITVRDAILDRVLPLNHDSPDTPGALLQNVDALVSSRSSHSATDVRTEVDANSTQLASIVGDTNELQSDWANGGRLDLILDSRASQASISSLNDPTVADIADAVWDEARAGHAVAGSFGEFIDAAISSRSSHAAPDLSNLDVAVSTRSSHSAPDLSNLDTLVSSRATPVDVKVQADQALVDIHLDHLLAVAYDAAAKPGAADALLNEMVEDDIGVTRYTANALEQAPSGGGGGNVTVGDLTQAALAKFANTDTGEITAITGSVAKLSQASGGIVGAGAIEWEILVNDAQGNPISDVAVWITTDELGSNVVAGTLYTDDFGKVIFMLDAGTYYSWKDHSAFNFNNPTEFTVA